VNVVILIGPILVGIFLFLIIMECIGIFLLRHAKKYRSAITLYTWQLKLLPFSSTSYQQKLGLPSPEGVREGYRGLQQGAETESRHIDGLQ